MMIFIISLTQCSSSLSVHNFFHEKTTIVNLEDLFPSLTEMYLCVFGYQILK